MIKVIFFIIAIFFSYKIIISKEGYKKLGWTIIGLILMHGAILVTDVPINMYIHRWLIFSLLLNQLYFHREFVGEFRSFPLKNTLIVLIIGSLSIAIFDDRLNLFYKFYTPFREMTETYFLIFLGYFAINSVNDIQKLAKPILIVLLFIASFGIFNWVTKQNPYHELIVNTYIEAGTAQYNLLIYSLSEEDRFRASSTFDQTFNYGYVSSLLALFFFSVFNSKNKELKQFSILAILGGITGTILCFSRTVLISASAAFFVLILLSTTLSKKIMVSAFIALTVFTMYFNIPSLKLSVDNSIDIFTTGGNKTAGSSLEMREIQLLGAYGYFLQSPIRGNGYGYIDNELGWGDRDHEELDPEMFGFESIVYQLMIEQGIIGLFTKSLLFISLIVFFLKKIKTNKNLSGLGLAIVVLFLSFSIGTGPLGIWPMSMLLLGAIIKTIVIKEQNIMKKNMLSLARIYFFNNQ